MNKALLFATKLALAVLLSGVFAFAAEVKAPAVKPAVKQSADAVAVQAPVVELIDINSATLEQLKKIPGVGVETAKKIVAGRPYVKKDQLKSRKIITAELYFKIKDRIIAKQIKNPSEK